MYSTTEERYTSLWIIDECRDIFVLILGIASILIQSFLLGICTGISKYSLTLIPAVIIPFCYAVFLIRQAYVKHYDNVPARISLRPAITSMSLWLLAATVVSVIVLATPAARQERLGAILAITNLILVVLFVVLVIYYLTPSRLWFRKKAIIMLV